MADGKTHMILGGVAGAGTSLVAAKAEDPGDALLAEVIGGLFGGFAGATLPDVLEPATWPGHRQFAHSVTAAGVIVATAEKAVSSAQLFCRDHASRAFARAAAATVPVERVLHVILGYLWHAAAGFFAGLAGGYVSHLLLDAATPAGLPLL